MIEVDVSGLALDAISAQPILLLNDKAKLRALPIWIGKAEARAIAFALEHVKSERPLTHDLLLQVIDQIGYQVTSVEINDLESSTYFATVFLTCREASEAVKCIDARPSDAIALAIASNAPIFVSPEVMELGSYPIKQEEEPLEEVKPEEFKEFVDNLKPSDFSKFMEEKEKKQQSRKRKKKAEPASEDAAREPGKEASREKDAGKDKDASKDKDAGKETTKETEKGSGKDKSKDKGKDKDSKGDSKSSSDPKSSSDDKPKQKPDD